MAPEATSFRTKLLVAMMLVVLVITATVLYLAQRNVEADVARHLHEEFRSEVGSLLAVQESRMETIAERCRALASSVRIRAALEEGDIEDLYLNAQVELRGVLDSSGMEGGTDQSLLHATFFRFLDAKGAVMSPSSATTEPWEAQLSMIAAPATGQVGYVTRRTIEGLAVMDQVIATPIISTDTGEVIGAIILGFIPIELTTKESAKNIKSGIWCKGELRLPQSEESSSDTLSREVANALNKPLGNSTVEIDGAPHLLFYKLLNPSSHFPPAYEVCLYPLADSIARTREVRWKIIGAGLLLVVGGLVASHFISVGLSAPVTRLAQHSAEHRERREQAETALEISREELLVLNAELQMALSDLKSSQHQIIQQERLRALGQMASGIAHDFNNALVPILGFCELLLLSPTILGDKQKAVSYLETIQTAAKDASSVVGRLREFYRPGKTGMAFGSVQLKRLVEQVITLTTPKWKGQAQANGATIEVSLELESVPSISGDESALREALTNLIFNAVDAMPAGGTLTLRTRRGDDCAVIEVADSGTGMIEEVRKHCLEPFFSTKGEGGTGLGLSMVFGIVQRHSGSLDIQSQPGSGTTFIIKLPLEGVTTIRTSSSVDAKLQLPLRILVVDDEAPVRDTLAAILTTDGHIVVTAVDGAEGLKRFASGQFDLVVTDKAMPRMNGEQMAAAIKNISPLTPIILLTGFGLFHDKEEFPQVDVLASKPIRIPALREAIAEALRHS